MLTSKEIESISKPYIRLVGSHWENEMAIPEDNIEDFVKAIESKLIEKFRLNSYYVCCTKG